MVSRSSNIGIKDNLSNFSGESPRNPRVPSRPYLDKNKLFASVGSGILAAAASHPLDLLRIRILLGNRVSQLKSALVKEAQKGRSLQGSKVFQLSKALSLTLFLSAFKSGAVWPLQGFLEEKIKLSNVTDFQSKLFAGAIGNILPNMLCAPLNMIRVHAMSEHTKVSFTEIAFKIFQESGIRGFYKGMPITILRDLSWGAIFFPLFGIFKRIALERFPDKKEVTINLLTSTSSAVVATASTAWLDAFRLHQMNSHLYQLNERTNWNFFKKSITPSKANAQSTFTGIFRVGFSTAIAYSAYDYFLQRLTGKKDVRVK